MSTAILTAASPLRLPEACLEHVKGARFHRKLDVLHIVEVILEVSGQVLQLFVNIRHLVLQGVDALGSPDPRHQILALGHGQVLSEEAPGAGARVPAEDYASARHFIVVAHHHGLDDRGGAYVR